MARKNKREPKHVEGPTKPLAHNPFAALASVSAPPAKDVSAPPLTAAPPTERATASRAETPAFAAKVVVRREKKGRGGKTVTRVTGVNDPRAAMPRMKRALGCGAALEDEDIVLLGDVGDRVARWLEAEGARRVVRGS